MYELLDSINRHVDEIESVKLGLVSRPLNFHDDVNVEINDSTSFLDVRLVHG